MHVRKTVHSCWPEERSLPNPSRISCENYLTDLQTVMPQCGLDKNL